MEIHSTGGETADVGDLVRTIIVDSTVTARMKRSEVLDNSRIQAGDVVVGFASYGKAIYEDTYNSGMGSNGLTSARHEVFSKEYASKYPESFDPLMPSDLFYGGKYKVTDQLPGAPLNIGQLVLSPTRTYAPLMIRLLDGFRPHLHGIVHCSGGGQTKILHFIEQLHVIKDNLFELPPLFKLIHGLVSSDGPGNLQEMYKVFNMGHRMEVYVPEKYADQIIKVSQSLEVEAQVIGRVESSPQKKVTIRGRLGEFTYA